MNFEVDQKISTHLAFLIILVLSFLVAWYTVNAGENILEYAKQSNAVNLEKRVRENDAQKIRTAPRSNLEQPR